MFKILGKRGNSIQVWASIKNSDAYERLKIRILCYFHLFITIIFLVKIEFVIEKKETEVTTKIIEKKI